MRLAYQTNTWGGVVGAPSGVTSIRDLFYLTHGSTEQALRDIASAGYEGFELFDGNLLEFERSKERFRALASRLAFVAVYSGANFIFPDVWPEEVSRLARAMELAGELGAEHFVVGGGAKRAAGTREDDYRRLAEGLTEVADMARNRGLFASYHPHLGTISESPEQIERIFRETDIGFCPDTAHLAAGGGDPEKLIRRHRGRIRYVHLKDLSREPFGFVPLGKGTLDFGGILAALRETKYDGWITVELDEYPGSKKAAAKISRKYLARH